MTDDYTEISDQSNLQDLLNNTSIAMALLNTDGVLLELNDEYARRFGKSKEQMLNTNALSYFPPEFAERRETFVNRAFETGVHQQTIDCREGIWNLIHCYPIKKKNNKTDKVAIYALNITEQRNAEIQLEESKELFNTCLNSLEQLVVVVDSERKISLVNSAFLQRVVVQGKLGHVIGKKVSDIFSSKAREITDDYNFVFKTGKTFTKKYMYELSNSKFYFKVKNTPVIEEGKVKMVVTTITDITSAKKTEEILRSTIATKEKYMSIIAHDLINPIHSLYSLTKILYTQYNDLTEEKRKRFIGTLFDTLERTNQLAVNLLAWSRSQRGQINFSPAQVQLDDLIDTLIALLRQQALEKNIRLYSVINCSSPVARADSEMLSTVIRNLVTNAIKFTHANGEVLINLERLETHTLRIMVKDTGVGIPEDKIKKLLNFDEDYTTLGTNNEKGTGLGLIICQEFLEKHNSKLHIESKIGEGSMFWFDLVE
ncbi:MAG: PAS domain-containing protein [Bacteroidales bacterium]|nr:PAS domain-containing protein [Bacteroidales bacterium]MBN2818223.1 PAS domain-containing protein [Bacteroidales bacterium]